MENIDHIGNDEESDMNQIISYLFLLLLILPPTLAQNLEIEKNPLKKHWKSQSLNNKPTFNRENIFPRKRTLESMIEKDKTDFNILDNPDKISFPHTWLKRFGTGRLPGIDGATSISVQPNGSVSVTGTSQSPVTNYDYITINYDSSGHQKWIGRNLSDFHRTQRGITPAFGYGAPHPSA